MGLGAQTNLRGNVKEVTASNRLTWLLFLIYLIAIFWIIVLKMHLYLDHSGGTGRANLIPYAAPMRLNGRVDYGEMILNAMIFVPFGLYGGALFKNWGNVKLFLLFFLSSLTCELSQYVLRVGAFDITDVINNTLGGLLGLMFFKGFVRLFGGVERAQKIVNVIAVLGTLFVFSALLYLRMNHLWIFLRRDEYG
jgi:glycopeptide antibiotics resistance protein